MGGRKRVHCAQPPVAWNDFPLINAGKLLWMRDAATFGEIEGLCCPGQLGCAHYDNEMNWFEAELAKKCNELK